MKTTLRKTVSLFATLVLLGNGAASLSTNAVSADAATDKRYDDKPSISACASAGDIEYIDYTRKIEDSIALPYNVPYYFSANLSDACGPTAGGIVVGYYDKYYEELIPNFTAYYPATGKYKRPDSTYVPAMLQSLYTLMQTNTTGAGVTEQDCLDGLEAYVEGKGRSISYTSVKGTSFSSSAFINAIDDGQPVLLFCNSVELVDLDTGDGQDEVIVAQTCSDHIVVGMGYRRFEYYDANDNNFRTDTYLKVATGWSANSFGYVKINDDGWLDSGYAVNIY